MENSESYLNLNSDQFNSWLSEFETQFNSLEKNNLTSSHSQEEDSICDSVEIECSSDSEEENDSNIFIKDSSYNISSEKDCSLKITQTSDSCTSSQRRSLYRVGRRFNNINSSSENQIKSSEKKICINEKKESKKSSKKAKKVKSNTSDYKLSDNQITSEDLIKQNSKTPILTIQQINHIIPKIGGKEKKCSKTFTSKHIVNEVKEVNEEKNIVINKQIKLGTQALYRFISNRR